MTSYGRFAVQKDDFLNGVALDAGSANKITQHVFHRQHTAIDELKRYSNLDGSARRFDTSATAIETSDTPRYQESEPEACEKQLPEIEGYRRAQDEHVARDMCGELDLSVCDETLHVLMSIVTRKAMAKESIKHIQRACKAAVPRYRMQQTLTIINQEMVSIPLTMGHQIVTVLNKNMTHEANRNEKEHSDFMEKSREQWKIFNERKAAIEDEVLAEKVAVAERDQHDYKLKHYQDTINELIERESTVLEKLSSHKKQEQAEQAAVIRNINEFNEILSMCSLESDRNAHRLVADTMVQLGSNKWRESRKTVAPVHEALDRIREERKQLETKCEKLTEVHNGLSDKIAEKASTVAEQRLQLEEFHAELQKHQLEIYKREEETFRVSYSLKQLKAVLQQLQQAYNMFWGAGALKASEEENALLGGHAAEQHFDHEALF